MTKFLGTILLLAIATNASAIPISVVGTQDSLVGYTTLANSSSASEEAWIESLLDLDIQYTQLDEAEGSEWQAVVGGAAGDYAFDFGTGIEPAYFLVKIGKPKGVVGTHFLFENFSALQWAYVNLADFGAIKLDNIGVISHVGYSGGGTTTIPEPSSLALLGAGLLAFGLFRRRKSAR